MSEFTVHLTASISASVTVEADSVDEAIKLAQTEGEYQGLCAHCTGYGKNWGKDEGDYEPTEVTDAKGETVWSEGETAEPDGALFPAPEVVPARGGLL